MNNIFENIAANQAEEIFTGLLETDDIHIQRIVSYGQALDSGRWYDQSDNEWVIVIKGEAQLEFENGRLETMKPGSYINIPAHTKHRVNWTKENTETIWLAVHYPV